MRKIANIGGIYFLLNINPCAHNCLYCYQGNQKSSNFHAERYLAVVERFLDWKQSRRLEKFNIPFLLLYCDDYDLATTKKIIELKRREKSYMQLYLGGLRMRSESEIGVWLRERQKMGIRNVIASFVGHGEVHDHWNNRVGDFDFLMSTLRIAAELGMKMEQRIFLLKSTLPCLEELINKLDTLPGKARKRTFEPLEYLGRAGKLESERLTEADLEHLPEQVKRSLPTLYSERQWIAYMRQNEDSPRNDVLLRFVLDDTNIDRAEAMSCDEIFADLEKRVRSAYAATPSQRELLEACGDPNSDLLYGSPRELERKWLDQYLEKHPLQYERSITVWGMLND